MFGFLAFIGQSDNCRFIGLLIGGVPTRPHQKSLSLIHQLFTMVMGDILETYQLFVNGFFQPLQSMVLSKV